MEKHVLYRDRQELQATDLLNTQDFADLAHAHLVSDAITPERQFVGLGVSAASSTELGVGVGRLYDGPSGQVYALEESQAHSVFGMLPLQDQKWLAVSVLGQLEDVDLEPRDFLIDLQSREVEPQTVAMLRRAVCVVHLAQGLESPTPERPEPPTGYTLIAHARLSPSGIQEVVAATGRRLPNLQRVDARLQAAEGWIFSMEPRLATMSSDMAGLASLLATRATREHVQQLGADIAGLKERVGLPDDAAFYGADHFLDDGESDSAYSGYAARIEDGLRMPAVASQTSAMTLLNPMDPAVQASADGFVLPTYREVRRLRLENQVGELTLNQYQYQTHELVEKTMTRRRVRYGPTRTITLSTFGTNGGQQWWLSGRYDPATGLFQKDGETFEVEITETRTLEEINGRAYWQRVKVIRLRQVWVDIVEVPYWSVETIEHTIPGSLLSQILLSPQSGWLTSVELYVTSVAADGALNLVIAEVESGQPALVSALSRATVAANSLSTGWHKIPLPRPVWVESGRRYAIVLITGAAHRVGYTEGTEYTQGTLQYSQDGQYFIEDADRDLMLRLNFARFESPRATVLLEPLQLLGGIHDIDLLSEAYAPDGTELSFEYQVGGQWLPMSGALPSQLGASALLPIRAVFVGTLDAMPGVRFSTSQAKVTRYAGALVHVSTERALASASDDIRVRILPEAWDDALHAVQVRLLVDDVLVEPDSTSEREVVPGTYWLEARFALVAPTSAYRIQIDASTSDAMQPFHISERYDAAL